MYPIACCRYAEPVTLICIEAPELGNADKIVIELAPVATDDVRALIGELDRTLAAEYLPEQRHGLALDAIFKPNIRFFLARLNGAAVGCGGVAFFRGLRRGKAHVRA